MRWPLTPGWSMATTRLSRTSCGIELTP
jgi:hypothetical protein